MQNIASNPKIKLKKDQTNSMRPTWILVHVMRFIIAQSEKRSEIVKKSWLSKNFLPLNKT
jgi:hypothetical protein